MKKICIFGHLLVWFRIAFVFFFLFSFGQLEWQRGAELAIYYLPKNYTHRNVSHLTTDFRCFPIMRSSNYWPFECVCECVLLWPIAIHKTQKHTANRHPIAWKKKYETIRNLLIFYLWRIGIYAFCLSFKCRCVVENYTCNPPMHLSMCWNFTHQWFDGVKLFIRIDTFLYLSLSSSIYIE